MTGKTYIEKPEYYYQDRVFLVLKETKEFVITKVINLESWKFNISKISRKKFLEKMEISPIQMSL